MKATGIVRRIDNLGRIVIPKEIRRTMHYSEGDSLEIFVTATGELILKKYSAIGELEVLAQRYADVLAKFAEVPILIADRERVVAVSAMDKEDAIGKRVSKEYDKLVQTRKVYVANDTGVLYPIHELDKRAIVCAPIIVKGDLAGSVILVEGNKEMASELQIQLAEFVGNLFSQSVEE